MRSDYALMDTSELIQDAVIDALEGRLEVFDSGPGYCLRVLRQITSAALGLSYESFYALLTHRAPGNDEGVPWAASLMVSLQAAGLEIPRGEAVGGCLAFTDKLAPQGHCGVLLSRTLLYENTGSQRGAQVSNYNRLSRVDELPEPDSWHFFRLR